jgi:preprotein translocase subunit SecA
LTFIPETYADYTQIKGRTARQGDPGSFDTIILQSDICEDEAMLGVEDFYNLKIKKWSDENEKLTKQTIALLDKAQIMHE